MNQQMVLPAYAQNRVYHSELFCESGAIGPFKWALLSGHAHVGETLGETRSHQHVLKRKLCEKGAKDVNNAWFKYFTLKRYYLGDNLFHQE